MTVPTFIIYYYLFTYIIKNGSIHQDINKEKRCVMRKVLLITMWILFLLSTNANAKDPMGLSNYVIWEPVHASVVNQHTGSQHFAKDPTTGSTYQERRLTNHEVDMFKKVGFIRPDGSIDPVRASSVHHSTLQPPAPKAPLIPTPKPQATPQAIKQAIPTPSPASVQTKQSKHQKTRYLSRKQVVARTGIQHSNHPNHRQIQRKPLPTSKQIASKTGTKHVNHPQSNGTVQARPANFPANPSRNDIVRMQKHIQHIERQVAKALDLSLSAYAVAELPQATGGHSGVSVGVSAADGDLGEAIGYSSNFGEKHEYTVKISLSHAGHQNAVGAGFGFQW